MAIKFKVLPPNPNVCQQCGRDHEPNQPHDNMRLQYQYWFHQEHGRFPTWKDAVAHCDEEIKEAWEWALKERNAWTE